MPTRMITLEPMEKEALLAEFLVEEYLPIAEVLMAAAHSGRVDQVEHARERLADADRRLDALRGDGTEAAVDLLWMQSRVFQALSSQLANSDHPLRVDQSGSAKRANVLAGLLERIGAGSFAGIRPGVESATIG